MSAIKKISPEQYADMRARQAEAKRQKTPGYQQQAAQEAAQHQREIRPFKRISWYLYASDKRMKLERRVTALYGCRTSWTRVLEVSKYYDVAENEWQRACIRRGLERKSLQTGQVVKMRQIDERWRKDSLQGVVQRVEGDDVVVQWIDGVTTHVARHRLLPIDIAGAVFVRTYDCDSNRKN